MSLMQIEAYQGACWEVDTRNGTSFVPQDVCGISTKHPTSGRDFTDGEYVALDGELTDPESALRDALADYIDETLEGVTYHADETLYRLSSLGFRDFTDWTTDPDTYAED